MFKVGNCIVCNAINSNIEDVLTVLYDWPDRYDCVSSTSPSSIVLKSHQKHWRLATEQEIAAGHRIDKTPLMQHLDKCEEVVKTWPKWKQQTIRDAFGIPDLETLRDCDVSPNCKVIEKDSWAPFKYEVDEQVK